MARFPIGRIGLVLLGLAGGTQLLAAQGTRPETHTVKAGDTLWQLARTYLGDPFLWPEIYRINTGVVEDPHWIYPGEVLRLAASADVTAVPTTDTPPPEAVATAEPSGPSVGGVQYADTLGPRGEEWKKYFVNRDDAMRQAISGYGAMAYRPLRRGEFYSSGFLTEGRKLPTGRLVGPVDPSQIGAANTRPTVLLSNRVYVLPPDGASYKTGDSLLVGELGPELGRFGHMVIPSGIIQVTEVAPGRTVARLFLDKGRRDGVAAGDIFEIRRTDTRRSDGIVTAPDVMAVVQVVHVGERSATVRIMTLATPVIADGSESRQVARLPS